MGSTNFQIWDQPQTNMETDAGYTGDTQRQNGGINGVAFPSATFNKFGLQASGLAYAVTAFLASKGYTILDSNIPGIVSALQSLFANVPGRNPLQQLSYSPALTLNVGAYLGFQISLAGNSVLSVTGQNSGDEIAFIFIQDSAGGRTVTWPSNFFGFVQPDPAPNSVSVQFGKVRPDLSFLAFTPMMAPSGINNTPIGTDAAASGGFTTLAASGAAALPILTTTTQASSDNSTNAATTAFVRALLAAGLAVSAAANGYIKLPDVLGGIVIQWGFSAWGGYNTPILQSFPLTFPNNCFAVMLTPIQVPGQHTMLPSIVQGSVNTSSFEWQTGGNSATDGQCPVFFIAVGN